MTRKPLALFAVQDGFSLFGFGVARDLIRMAADADDTVSLEVLTAAQTAGVIQSSCGASVLADCDWSDLERSDYVFVCSTRGDVPATWDSTLINRLRHCHRYGGWVIGLGTGVAALANAGLLNGKRAVAHPAQLSSLQSSFPTAQFLMEPFAIDGRIATCIGGDAVTDMMLDLLSQGFNSQIAENVRRSILLKPARSGSLLASIGLRQDVEGLDPRLVRFIQFIEQTFADPKTLDQICTAIAMSSRTLTRLTTDAFGCPPGVLSVRLRLSYAADLLQSTTMSLQDVAEASGFGSAAYFSEAFHKNYAIRPGKFRKLNWNCRTLSNRCNHRPSISAG